MRSDRTHAERIRWRLQARLRPQLALTDLVGTESCRPPQNSAGFGWFRTTRRKSIENVVFVFIFQRETKGEEKPLKGCFANIP